MILFKLLLLIFLCLGLFSLGRLFFEKSNFSKKEDESDSWEKESESDSWKKDNGSESWKIDNEWVSKLD